MPDLWMDVDAALSEVPINLVALIDDSDFKTREESVTYDQAGLDLLWNFVTPAGAMTQTAVTPTDTGGAYDWVNQGNAYYTIEIPASGGGTINNDTEGFGWFSGFATGVLPWRGPVIGFRAAGLNNVLIESAYSATRGLAGTALPAAAADAAGGLIISDAGGLDSDTEAANVADMQPIIEKAAYEGPDGLGVWIDDGAANTNTVLGTDGTEDNPVSTIAAATTIATALGSQRFYLINDTDITLAQGYPSYEFIGIGEMAANTIDLGSQDVDTGDLKNVLVTGAQGGTGRFQAEGCVLSVITSMEITALGCLIGAGTLTLRNDCMFDSCWSAVAGAGTPILDINSVANVSLYFRHYSGGLQINNAVATTVMSYDCPAGQFVIDASCTSLTVSVRGSCSITDNGTTTSLTQDAAINAANINAEADAALSDYDAPTKAEMDTAHALLATPADVATELGTYDGPTKAEMDTAHALLATPAQVNTEVADVLETDTHAEPSAVVAATTSIKDAIMWLKALSRNKGTQTSTTKTLRNDADDADIGSAAISSDGTTFTREEWS